MTEQMGNLDGNGRRQGAGWRKAAAAAVSVAALASTMALTSCSRDYTVAYVYATSAKSNPGTLNVYGVDYQTGALNQLADSGVALGKNPISLVATPSNPTNSANSTPGLFVLNHDDSSIQVFAVGTDGKVYLQQTVNTNLGVFPVSASVDPSGSFLYVVFTETPPAVGSTAAVPPGELQVFPIKYGSNTIMLGSPIVNSTIGVTGGKTLNYFPVGNNPTAVFVSYQNYVYVIDQEPVGTGLAPGAGAGAAGIVLAFKGSSTGQLTLVPGTTITPLATGGFAAAGFLAGLQPQAIAVTPNGNFVYVVDKAQNLMFAFIVGTAGQLVPIANGPFATGQYPVAVTVDPRGAYIYVANYNESTVSPYAINRATGAPSLAAGGATKVGTEPNCVTIEPARGIYLYTSNYLDNTLSGLQLSANTGTLQNIQSTPFPANALPSCVVSIANGSHATQLVTP